MANKSPVQDKLRRLLDRLDVAYQRRDEEELQYLFLQLGSGDELEPDQRVRLLLYRAGAARLDGDGTRALEMAEQAREVANKHGDEDGLIKARLELGRVYKLLERAPEAVAVLESALEQLRDEDELSLILETNTLLGWAYRVLGEYDAAESVLRWNLDRAERHGRLRSQAVACANLGVIYKRGGRTVGAKQMLRRAAETFAELQDKPREAVSRLNLGNVHKSAGDYEAAKREYQHCLVLTAKTGQDRFRGGALCNLGLLLTRRGDFVEARGNFLRALELFRRGGNSRWEGNVLHGLGMLALQLGGYAEAEERLGKSLGIYRTHADPSSQAGSLAGLGAAAFRQNRLADGRRFYNEAIRLKEELGERRLAHLYLLELAWYLTIARAGDEIDALVTRAEEHARSIAEPVEPKYTAAVTSWRRLNKGDIDGAQAAGSRAVKLTETQQEPPLDALAALAYGRALLAAGWLRQSDLQLNRARNGFEELTMPYEAALAWRASVDYYRRTAQPDYAELAAERCRELAASIGAEQILALCD